MAERLGHRDSSIAGVYSHPTDRVRADLLGDLEVVWEDMLEERRALSRSSRVALLERLLQASAHLVLPHGCPTQANNNLKIPSDQLER